MLDVLQRECTYLWYYIDIQLRQIFPYWALGIVVGSLVSVFLKEKINRLMAGLQGKSWGLLGIFPAAALGIVSPLCMYGTVPIVASLSRSGMREDWIAAFMMSSILLNPQLFFYSMALGTSLAAIRLTVALLGGILAGVLVRIFFQKKSFYQFDRFDVLTNRDTDPNPVLRVLKNIWRNIKITFPYFALGIVLTALYQRYVPSDVMERLFGFNRGLGALLAAALGVPLYTCGGGTIPLIAAWLNAGMSRGSAVAFMISGPATKLTNLGAIKTALQWKQVLLYLGFSILFATLAGVAVDWMGV